MMEGDGGASLCELRLRNGKPDLCFDPKLMCWLSRNMQNASYRSTLCVTLFVRGLALPQRLILINGRGDANFLVAASRHYGRYADFRKPIVRLETAKGRHKVLDLASRRGFAGLEVALNA
jgi:hypothetical protein